MNPGSWSQLRTKPTQLPSYDELCRLLAHEAVWPIPPEKQSVHFGDFSTIISLLDHYGLSTRFFTEDLTFESLADPSLFAEITTMFDDLVTHILSAQHDPQSQSLCNALYDYLSEEDRVATGDVIFVFGSKTPIRTDTAISLYRAGVAPKIVISGGCPFYELGKGEPPEAETLGAYARECGVPDEDLILETESISVPDNVKRSLILLEKEGIPHEHIVSVTSPFSQRRAWTHLMKMTRPDTTIIRANARTVSPQFSRDGWYTNETGAQIIVKEFFGLRASSLLNTG